MEVPDVGPYADKDWPDPQKGHAAMITRLDRDVGRLFAKLRDKGIDSSTIVLFTSDNGPHREGGGDPDFFDANGPLKGIKRDLYEGGIRVPMIVRWPGKAPAGTTSAHIGYFADFLATAAELSGSPIPARTDGISFLPSILGKKDAQKTHDALYWEFYERGSAQAIRVGRWKGVVKPFWGPLELYDLEEDVGETTDVASDHPEIVEKLRAAIQAAHVPSASYRVPTPRKKKASR
jgi:uncharacterized sulfatase